MVRLTPREREVLIELCRPLLERARFHEPAATREIARKLFVTEAAVKQHLLRMYEKLDIPEGSNRRSALANIALEKGILTTSELADSADEPRPQSLAPGDALAEGRALFTKRAWQAAFERLSAADAGGGLGDPADLAKLGEAA